MFLAYSNKGYLQKQTFEFSTYTASVARYKMLCYLSSSSITVFWEKLSYTPNLHSREAQNYKYLLPQLMSALYSKTCMFVYL